MHLKLYLYSCKKKSYKQEMKLSNKNISSKNNFNRLNIYIFDYILTIKKLFAKIIVSIR